MPMQLKHIPKFEKQNEISVCVFGYEKGVYPLHISKHRFPTHVNLLLIHSGDNHHYCLIKNLDRLLSHQNKHYGHTYFCPYCLHGYTSKELEAKHRPYCEIHGPQKIKMPTETEKILKFKNFAHQLKVPVVIYADFECLLPKTSSCQPNPLTSHTTTVEKHIPCGYCYRVVCINEKYSKPAVLYRGADCVDKFLKALQYEEGEIKKLLKRIEPMSLTDEDELAFQTATMCHICGKCLGSDKIKDHDHLKEGHNYRGAAHNSCNLQYKFPHYVPVIFHGLRNYDSHLLISGIGKLQPKRVTCIANNMEKYMSFSVGSLRFIDSAQFLNASLYTLVNNLAKEGSDKFPSLCEHFPNLEQRDLVLRKGVFPYSHMVNVNSFLEQSLPSKKHFYNILSDEPISDDDYNHAQNVWDKFQMRNLGEYHDLYLKTDVLLLESVFENFRSICLEIYSLDPAHYLTSPGLSWSAALRMTGVEIELLTDLDKHLFIEKGIRGGVAMIGKKHCRANNPYTEGYDSSKPLKFVQYVDCNNLYGAGM